MLLFPKIKGFIYDSKFHLLVINLTLPVYNEEECLESKVRELVGFLEKKDYAKELFLVFSNNGSTDSTGEVCDYLVKKISIKSIHYFTPYKGKGRAVKQAWQNYPAEQYWFMDADLSTSLDRLDEMHAILQSKQADLVIGSRRLKESRVNRSLKREVISQGYNLLLDMVFRKGFSDAQCGFKGVSHEVVESLLPLVKSNDLFFDTELLVLAEKRGYTIKEIPVTWIERRESRINIYKATSGFMPQVFELYLRLRKT